MSRRRIWGWRVPQRAKSLARRTLRIILTSAPTDQLRPGNIRSNGGIVPVILVEVAMDVAKLVCGKIIVVTVSMVVVVVVVVVVVGGGGNGVIAAAVEAASAKRNQKLVD